MSVLLLLGGLVDLCVMDRTHVLVLLLSEDHVDLLDVTSSHVVSTGVVSQLDLFRLLLIFII